MQEYHHDHPPPTTNLREHLFMEKNDMKLIFLTLKEIDQELLEKQQQLIKLVNTLFRFHSPLVYQWLLTQYELCKQLLNI